MLWSRALTFFLAVLACCLALTGVAGAIACDPGRCTTFQAPGASGPVVAGPDGNVWFLGDGFVGRMDVGGAVIRFPASVGSDSSLVAGTDALYFTTTGAVGRMTTDGQYTLTRTGQGGAGPLAASPDGTLWLAAGGGVMALRIGDMASRATDVSQLAQTAARSPAPAPTAMVRGPDGAVWFAESGRAAIGRLAADGTISHYPLPAEFGAQIGGLTAGPDGGVWFTAPRGFRVGRLSTRGTFTSYRTSWNPYAITAGPSHAIWFAMTDSGRWTVVRMVPAGYMSYWQVPGAVRGMGVGPDNAVYITHAGSIERLLPFLGAYPVRGRAIPMSPWTYAVTMRFYCPQFDLVYCAGTVALRYRGRSLGTTPFSQRVNDAPSTRMVLNAYGRRLVRRMGRVRVKATLSQHDAGAATRQTTYAFELVRRHK
jgi:virginiamycin B lyase